LTPLQKKTLIQLKNEKKYYYQSNW